MSIYPAVDNHATEVVAETDFVQLAIQLAPVLYVSSSDHFYNG